MAPKEAKIKAFKAAFTKPKTPNKDVGKLKTQIEKGAKNIRKGKGNTDLAKHNLGQACSDLKKADEAYYRKLLAYKLTKHWNDAEDFKTWTEAAPLPVDLTAAVRQVLEENPGKDDMIVDCWKKLDGNREVTALCYELAPAALLEAAVKQVKETGTRPTINSPDFQSALFKALFADDQRTDMMLNLMDDLNANDARDVAARDPDAFIESFLDKTKATTKVKLLKDRQLREILTRSDKFVALALKAPMLSFFAKIDDDVDKMAPDEGGKMAAVATCVFDELISDGSVLPMTYFTNTFTSPSTVLGATPDEVRQIREQKMVGQNADVMPEGKAAQCDELVTILKDLMEGSAPGIECRHIVIPGIVLTVDISTLPGGLLKNNFGGNVRDDGDSLTKQVLFTGNTDGEAPNSHTYLEVNGVKYDAVLGTSGDAVTAAVADEFEPWQQTGWVTNDDNEDKVWVTKSKSTDKWIVKQAGLKAAPNRNGFSTAYRITSDVAQYAKRQA